MEKNKLIDLLQCFSRKEMTRFREFVHSDYYNKHGEVRRLVGYLSQIYPHLDAKNCHRQRVFRHIYGQQKHNQKQLALVFTYAYRLLERFLALESGKSDFFAHQLSLLRALRQKGHSGIYLKSRQSAAHTLRQNPQKDKNHYFHQYLLADESDQYYVQSERSFKKDESLQEKQMYLDFFYISEKLSDACEMLTRSAILKVEYEAGLLALVIAEVKSNEMRYSRIPSVVVYYRIYQMLTHRDKAYFDAAKVTILSNEIYFSTEELHRIYNYLLSFCVAQVNNNRTLFLRELFDLYRLLLDKQLIFEKGYLSEWYYKNIVTVGIRLGEMDWVYAFIEQYKAQLEPELAENAYRFNLASYYYSTHQLDQVLKLLHQVEYTDRRYGLGARALMIRTYYDLDEYEAFISLSEAFKKYIKRDKSMEDSRKRGLSNLLRYTKRTFQIRARLEYQQKEKLSKEIGRLSTEIAAEQNIINKAWLKTKVDELA